MNFVNKVLIVVDAIWELSMPVVIQSFVEWLDAPDEHILFPLFGSSSRIVIVEKEECDL